MKELNNFRKFLAEDKFEDETKEFQALLDLVKDNDEADAMVGDGFFFSEEPAPAVNQTQEAIRDEEDEDYMEALEVITNAVKQLGGTVSYMDENGLSLNYYVKGDDLFTHTRETFEVPTNEGEGADASYYTMTAAKKLAKKDGHNFDKLPKFARGKGAAHQQKYLDMAKAEKAKVSEEDSKFPLIYINDEDWLETFDRERLDYEVEDENSQKGIGIRVFTPEDHNKLKSILGKLAWNEDLSENTQSEDRMVKQIERALKDNISMFELPTATQDYYRKNKSDFLSENALGVDREDGTFEITPDFQVMGQSFNFSDICPSAHKLVQNQAIVHQGFSRTAPIVLRFAILHRDFFALERKALGAQGIDIDTFKNDVTRLYVEILNVAEKLGVRKQAKEYMDMHLGKIKDAGFKASEPGGSSDRNFEEQLAEVRNRLGNEIEGYTDLHKNDVALEAFLGKEELNEGKYKVSISKNGSPSETILYDTEEKANAEAKKVNGGFMDYEGAKFKATVAKHLEEGPYGSKTGYQVNYKTMDNKVVSAGSEIFASKDEAKSFMEKIKADPKVISVQIWEFYGSGSTRDSGAQYLGGSLQIDRYTHPAYYKKNQELSPEEESIKNYLGSPSFTHKRYGITQDFKLMDIINQQQADRKAYIASLDESLEE